MHPTSDTLPQPPLGVRMAPSSLRGAGRGMFAVKDFAQGDLIESCPVIALPDHKDRARLRRTGLVNYYFLWGPERTQAAICLGYGSLYNHSYEPNARWDKQVEEERMDFYAISDISAGEEITVNYNGNPDDTRELWIHAIPPANAVSQSDFAARHPVRYRLALGGVLSLLALMTVASAVIHLG